MAKPSIVVFFFIFFVWPCLSCPQYQKEALLHFKSSILTIDSSFNTSMFGLESWNLSSNCCQWDRVRCNSPSDSTSRAVIRLDLSHLLEPLDSQLVEVSSGILAPLFYIRTLKVLDVSYNNIRGGIPQVGFSNLSKLVHLDLHWNWFNGSIPSQLFHLQHLRYLNLSYNSFNGIPSPALGSLHNLLHLDLSGNEFNGSIPPQLFHLQYLQYLSLRGNSFNGILSPQLGTLRNLVHLDLSGNWFDGSIPPQLFHLKHLQYLDLSGIRLNGSIPPQFFHLQSLKYLALSSNNLSGGIPSSIQNLSKLVSLDMSGNRFAGSIPPQIGNLTMLQRLSLWGNQFSSGIPCSILSSKELEELDLSNNQLIGGIPSCMQKQRKLRILRLGNNFLTGEIPPSLFCFEALEELFLGGNHLTWNNSMTIGGISSCLQKQSKLRVLGLQNNLLTGDIPPWLFGFEALEELHLGWNHLTWNNSVTIGGMPSCLQKQSKLTLLGLENNLLTGEIPPWLFGFEALEVLYLGGNHLTWNSSVTTGGIPSCLQKQSNLRVLLLEYNLLTGEIPPWLFGFEALEELYLGWNHLTWNNGMRIGGITSCLQKHNQLRVLGLQNNLLTGEIPPWLFGFETLEELYLGGNHLTWNNSVKIGGIPSCLQKQSKLRVLGLENNLLTGEIPPWLFGFEALEELYLGWNHLTWNNSAMIGGMPSCLQKQSKLTLLGLENNLLTGEIPPWLFGFEALEVLYLGGNHLTWNSSVTIGGIPTCLQKQSKLRVLRLEHNMLAGEIPPWLFGFEALEELYLGWNHLTWNNSVMRIPSFLQKQSKLRTLGLENNLLTEEIPPWLFGLEALEALYLGGNHVLPWNSSVRIVPKCMLQVLSLKSCGLAGEIPGWISTQKDLYHLDLSKNDLQGTFPQWLAEMHQVEFVFLSDNKLTGSLPAALFHSDTLEVLDLSRNKFSGKLPINIGDARNLKIVMLADNNFSGPIPQSISSIPGLLLMDLSRNRFSGNIFPVFDPQGSLTHVDFSSNKFWGKLPTTFSRRAVFLAMGGNNFSGALPQNLSKLSSLVRLDLQDNKLTGEFPNFLSQISTLQFLNLRNNSFESFIPPTISNLSKLQILDVSHNNLKGEIPTSFGNFVGMIQPQNLASSFFDEIVGYSAKINDLIINWKKSKQGLPIRSLGNYTLLDLSNNQLSGKIPASLGSLKALKLLNISYNKLSGKIPSSLGDLRNIESLDLSHNQLSGSIPPTLAKLQQLTTLDVSNNQLTGQIPIGGQMDTMFDPNSYANNSGLCGMQIHVSCPEDRPRPSQQPKPKASNKKEAWFSWKGVLIGYPIGFLFAIEIIFLTGYFSTTPSRNSHCGYRPYQR